MTRARRQCGWLGLVFGTAAGRYQEVVHHQQEKLEEKAEMGEACRALLRHWACLVGTVCDVVVTSSTPEPTDPQAEPRVAEGGEGGAAESGTQRVAGGGSGSRVAKLRAMADARPLAYHLGEGLLEVPRSSEGAPLAEVVIVDFDDALGEEKLGGLVKGCSSHSASL